MPVWILVCVIISCLRSGALSHPCSAYLQQTVCNNDTSYNASCPDCIGCDCPTCISCYYDTEEVYTGFVCGFAVADDENCYSYSMECQGDNCTGERVYGNPCGLVLAESQQLDPCPGA
jgi:hypothetical protein